MFFAGLNPVFFVLIEAIFRFWFLVIVWLPDLGSDTGKAYHSDD